MPHTVVAMTFSKAFWQMFPVLGYCLNAWSKDPVLSSRHCYSTVGSILQHNAQLPKHCLSPVTSNHLCRASRPDLPPRSSTLNHIHTIRLTTLPPPLPQKHPKPYSLSLHLYIYTHPSKSKVETYSENNAIEDEE